MPTRKLLLRLASVALVFAAAGVGRAAGLAVDTAKREEARIFYNSVYSASEDVEMGFTGNVATGVPGTTDAGYREAVRRRVNWFRAMAGIPADVAFSDVLHAKCQQAALMMSANDQLSHNPPLAWIFYTTAGAEAADKSNLFLGEHGPKSITGYIEDPGAENAPLGHRRWILYPQTQTMGTGDVPAEAGKRAANALWVFDSNFGTTRPPVRDEFVAWPPPGNVPYQVVFPRWSFSYPGADFSSATVALTVNGQPLGAQVEPVTPGYGENTFSWIPADRDLDVAVGPAPSQDLVTTVNVSGVKIGGQTRSFTYTVRVFDPAVPGADTVFAAISGPATTTFALPADFTCAAVPRATGYEWEVSTPGPMTEVEGAEHDLDSVIVRTSGSYNVISTVHAGGSKGFHFANPDFRPQSLELDRVILPSVNSTIRWQSRLGWASDAQTARVQVSVDEGLTWIGLFAQKGTDSSGEKAFVSRSKSLAQFAGRAIRVRFVFDYQFGESAYLSTDNGVGWHVDDIAFTDAEELTDPSVSRVDGATAFQFTPPSAASLALRVRPVFFGEFPGEWAPVKHVEATAPPAMLTVNVNPPEGGSVSGVLPGTTLLRVGDEVVVKAKPARGFLFTQWSGGVNSIESKIGFSMPENLLIAANFIPTPWPAARGAYTGLLSANPASRDDAGMLTVALNGKGGFTGKVIIAGKAKRFAGKFDAFGNAVFGGAPALDLSGFGIPVSLALTTDVGASPLVEITASLVLDGVPSDVPLTRSLFTGARSPAPPLINIPDDWRGNYTVRLSADVPAGPGPRGDGWALLKISADGTAKLAGRLADGTAFAAGGKVQPDGTVPVYSRLYRRAGAFVGNAVVEDLSASDISGAFRWFRPAASSGRFASGWPGGLDTDLSGSRYERPVMPARVLAALEPVGDATASAEFAAVATWPVVVSDAGRITATDSSLRSSLKSGSGVWKGSFLDPSDGRRIPYRGVVLQKEGIFAGYFLTPDDGGRIRLVP